MPMNHSAYPRRAAGLDSLIAVMLALQTLSAVPAVAGSAGIRDLQSIRVLENGDVLAQVEFSEPFLDPESCNGYGTGNPWAVLKAGHPGFLGLYSLAFSSATSTNFPLEIFVDGCDTVPIYGGFGVPVIVSLATAE